MQEETQACVSAVNALTRASTITDCNALISERASAQEAAEEADVPSVLEVAANRQALEVRCCASSIVVAPKTIEK